MAENYEDLLAKFELRMRQLMFLCDSLQEENNEMRVQLSEKNTQIELLNANIEHLKSKYDNLKFVKSFGSQGGEEVEKAKLRLSRLVREVDKCITLLKN